MIYYIMGGAAAAFVLIIIAYVILSKKMQKSEYKQIQRLQEGTKVNTFSTEILFQKLYLTYTKIPFIKRYALKIRRRLEIINIDVEYNTRKGTVKKCHPDIMSDNNNNDNIKQLLINDNIIII